MNRRVFISHTTEIKEYPRRGSFLDAALKGVSEAGWVPVEMETFLPAAKRTPEALAELVKGCDAFIGILGFKWGSEVPEKPGLSYCEFEFAVARDMQKDVRLVLIDESTIGFPVGYIQGIPPNEGQKQQSFRKEAKGYLCGLVNEPEDLRVVVIRTLLEIERTSPPSLQTLKGKIETYLDDLSRGQYDLAWDYFRKHLNEELDFIYSENHLHLTLLLKLFREDIEKEPPLTSNVDKAAALSALGRAYKNIGEPRIAVRIYRRQLDLQGTSGQHAIGLANLANALRLTGQLSEAEDIARMLLEQTASVNLYEWHAYGLYWNGVLRAGRGLVDDGVLLLREAQVLFEDIYDRNNPKYAQGVGRVYAHLAQIELWLGNPQVALSFAQHAERLTRLHGQLRERIFAARLIGTAYLFLRNLPLGEVYLTRAQKDAYECGYFEEELAASVGLAELERLRGNLARAVHALNDILRNEAERRGYALLLSDFDNTLCQIYQSERSDDKAVGAAKRALDEAKCGQRPFWYYWGLERARKSLLELHALSAEMLLSTFSSPSSLPARLIGLTGEQVKRAKLRAEFTKRFRWLTGPYRYVPSKFTKMVREDWDAIRSIVADEPVDAKPQFVEVHVGHPCNLSCLYCRGELRKDVPGMEQSLKTETLLQLTESIRELNRGASVRFSGLIGEPLLPRDIVKVFEAVNDKGLSWGLTTNGIRMDGDRLRRSMLKATYVHVSVDAGSDETYQRLKKGQAGDFDKVIKNIALLARTKRLHRYGPEIIVSFLLQEMNYGELPSLAVRAKAVGVDTLEVKMQHFDKRRVMSKEAVDAAYLLIDTLRGDMSDGGFRVVVVQERDEALHKIEEDAGRISFSRCYANLLGLNATVDPTGEVQACCQYYQRTLGPMGNITQDSFETIWHGDRRRDRLQDDPREHCINCSPSDEFVNQFVEFLRLAHRRDPEFLNWVEEEALVGANGRSGLT